MLAPTRRTEDLDLYGKLPSTRRTEDFDLYG
jgi:hypothetical protein